MIFLKSQPWRYLGTRLLHVGVGNCSFAVEFAASLKQYVGITISLPEIVLFEQKLANFENAKVFLLNKYDPRFYGLLDGQFDIIVDTLLKSATCCEKHFEGMMEFFTSRLTIGGMLITTETGVQWGWKGNTKRAYTPGAQLDPSVGKLRVLTRNGLRSIGERLGLSLTAVRIDGSLIGGADDHLLILTKS